MLNAAILALDIATLRTLLLVHRLGSFSAAAEELGVKQSSVSYTIDRIRRALDDPLFVRQGGGIAATDRCQEAVKAAEHVLSEMEALAAGAEFDPAQSNGTVTITTGFLVQSVILPAVMQRIRREARGLKLRVLPPCDVDTALFDRNSDLAILPLDYEASGVYRQDLFTDREVALMDRANPLATGELDLETYAAADHVSFELGFVTGFRQAWLRKLIDLGYAPNIVSTSYDGLMVSHFLRGTDLVATLASLSAERIGGPDLTIKQIPMDIQVHVKMYWTASANRAPLNRWLRQVIFETVADLGLS